MWCEARLKSPEDPAICLYDPPPVLDWPELWQKAHPPAAVGSQSAFAWHPALMLEHPPEEPVGL
jgi:hypothetical protein